MGNRSSIITAIDNAARFPEAMEAFSVKYDGAITYFHGLITQSSDSGDLLRIRNSGLPGKQRMALLKIFRRCVAPVADTEATKKSEYAKPTSDFVMAYGHTFKPLPVLREQFDVMSSDQRAALAALIGEYDTRGPCDFVVTDLRTRAVLAIGFARYDATRGGGQSDDRTGGNADKLHKLESFCASTGRSLRLFYLADGPGLDHNDTWKATCDLDGEWNENVRVTTFKLAPQRITPAWLRGEPEGLSPSTVNYPLHLSP